MAEMKSDLASELHGKVGDKLYRTLATGKIVVTPPSKAPTFIDEKDKVDRDTRMVDRSTAVCVEDQITRTHLGRTDTSSCSRLGTRMMRQADAEVCHNRHRKSRTIRTICQAGTAPYIRIPKELSRVVCDLRTLGGTA